DGVHSLVLVRIGDRGFVIVFIEGIICGITPAIDGLDDVAVAVENGLRLVAVGIGDGFHVAVAVIGILPLAAGGIDGGHNLPGQVVDPELAEAHRIGRLKQPVHGIVGQVTDLLGRVPLLQNVAVLVHQDDRILPAHGAGVLRFPVVGIGGEE